MPDQPSDPDLAASARHAWRIAPATCRTDPRTGATCADAHRAWQYLRLLGIVGTIEYREPFYLRALAGLPAASAAPRVLISGAADHAMLALVLAAVGGRRPRVTVLDLCETPLAVCRRHAGRSGTAIETVRCDILDYRPAEPFDLVCTDSFLGRFPPAARPSLMRQWHALLRPGGRLVTANALRSPSAPERLVFSAEQVTALGDAAGRAASELRGALDLSREEAVAMAEAYARQQVTYTVRSVEEVRALLDDAGFRVDAIDILRVNAVGADAPSAPSVKRRNAAFVTVIASRV